MKKLLHYYSIKLGDFFIGFTIGAIITFIICLLSFRFLL